MKKSKSVCLTLTGLLFALGLLLLLMPGMRFSALFFQGCAGVCLMGLLLGKLAEERRCFKICQQIFLVGVLTLSILLCAVELLVLSEGEHTPDDCPVDAVIVLGAGVNGETPSLALQTRIDAAASYRAQHPDVPVILSGGQGSGENISEAECMRRALASGDASDALLWTEDRSTSTAENFAFSKALLEERGIQAETVAVVTNDFHAFRSRLIAEREGLTAIMIPAELPWWWLTANYYLREAFAVVKTVLFD